MAANEQIQKVNRRLGRAERFFWLFDQASTMSFSFYALLNGELDISDLQQAMNRLQQEQAMLRVRVCVEANKVYFRSVEGLPIEVQLLKSDTTHWRKDILEQAATPFAANAYPLIKCFYMPMKEQSVVFFICHHAIAGGTAVAHLMRRLLMLATNPVMLNEPVDTLLSHPALDDLLPTSYQGVKGCLRALVNRLTEMRDWYRYGNPTHISVFKRKPLGRCQVACVFFKLSQSETSHLLLVCKEKGFSLQSVLIAAQLYALNSSEANNCWRPMAISSPVDLRAQLTEAVPENEVGLYISFVLTVLKLKEGEEFWSIVEKAHEQLKLHLSRDAALSFWRTLPPDFLFKPTGKGAKRLLSVSGGLSPASSIISNLGRISYDGLKGVKVLESSFNLCPSALTSLCTAVTTVNGELSIGLNYDEKKMKYENVAVITDIIRILLVRAVDA